MESSLSSFFLFGAASRAAHLLRRVSEGLARRVRGQDPEGALDDLRTGLETM